MCRNGGDMGNGMEKGNGGARAGHKCDYRSRDLPGNGQCGIDVEERIHSDRAMRNIFVVCVWSFVNSDGPDVSRLVAEKGDMNMIDLHRWHDFVLFTIDQASSCKG